MALVISVREKMINGLYWYEVVVNGTVLSQWPSREMAEHKKTLCLHAWNVEKIGQTHAARSSSRQRVA